MYLHKKPSMEWKKKTCKFEIFITSVVSDTSWH